jgi:hypothetical protein
MSSKPTRSNATPLANVSQAKVSQAKVSQAKASQANPKLRAGNWAIGQLPGLSEQYQTQLQNLGIHTTYQLLQQTKTPQQKQQLASRLCIHLQHLNKWVALANLAQIPAVGCQHCGLLLHAGVSSPFQLAQTPLPRLHRQLLKLHVATLQRQDLCPALDEVALWIEQAKQMTRRSSQLGDGKERLQRHGGGKRSS